jgi:hypothetical protein
LSADLLDRHQRREHRQNTANNLIKSNGLHPPTPKCSHGGTKIVLPSAMRSAQPVVVIRPAWRPLLVLARLND